MSDKITYLTEENYDEVMKGDKPVMIDFWATWCGPCRMFAPIYEQTAEKYGDKIVFCKCDVDENPTVAEKHSVESIPTIEAYAGGEKVYRQSGVQSAAAMASLCDKIIG